MARAIAVVVALLCLAWPAQAGDAHAAAQPDHLLHAFDTPNDPYFATAGAYLSAIRLPQAWDISHGSLGVVIAVPDSGVSSVGDLSAQILPGRNFVAGNADARDDSLLGHGTLVAGVAAATTHNGIGIAGAAWNASVLPVKVLDNRGYGTDSQVAAGILWAADHGADIINLSSAGRRPARLSASRSSTRSRSTCWSSRPPETAPAGG
jgi:subtilisin family serine protease